MTKPRVSWLITDHNVTVNYNGQTHIVSRDDKLSDRLIEAVKTQQWNQIPDLVSASKRVEKFSKGKFVVRDGEILVNGLVVPGALGKKILKFSEEGLPYQPLVKFAENLQNNPSFRAVNELFQFLEKNDHPITENGCFIAYKRVRHDFKDIYTGTFDNSPGKTLQVARNQVDEDCTRTCSHGLHVANWDYAHTKYSTAANDIMLEVEVNPADVVAVPIDYDQSKMRVCAYKVLGVVDKEHSSDVSLRVVNQDNLEEMLDDDDDDDDEVEETCRLCGEYLDDLGSTDGVCADCEYDRCDLCGDVDCYGECEDDEEDTEYPFDKEL